MARFTGTSGVDQITGTSKKDIIRGLGGPDTIDARAGNDLITGSGNIRGGPGNDSYFQAGVTYGVNPDAEIDFRQIDLDEGADLMVLNGHDALNGRGNYGGFASNFGVDLGDGNDTLVVGSFLHQQQITLGEGSDTAWLMPDPHDDFIFDVSVVMGALPLDPDDDRDIVHIDAAGAQVALEGFSQNDRIVVHGLKMNAKAVRKATEFDDGSRTDLTLTLRDGTRIDITKEWSGHLGNRVDFEADQLTYSTRIMVGNEAKLTKALFGSGAGDALSQKGGIVLAGAGDDTVTGGGGADRQNGEHGDDRLVGRDGADTQIGGFGDDTILGGGGRDRIETGAGADVVKAGGGNDDILVWRGGGSRIDGQGGADRLTFDDQVIGPFRDQDLYFKGGKGADDFVVEQTAPGTLVIEDFGKGADTLILNHWPFHFDDQDKSDGLDTLLANATEVTAGGPMNYPVDGLLIALGVMDILLKGRDADDLTRGDLDFG